MKIQNALAFLVFLNLSMHASAQIGVPPNEANYNRPKAFADLPAKFPIRITDLSTLLDLPIGAKVNAKLAQGLVLNGVVTSKSNGSDANVKSVVVKTADRQGSTFTFTRITAADGTVSFIGRMFGKAGGDALEIAHEEGAYFIRKKGIYDVVNE